MDLIYEQSLRQTLSQSMIQSLAVLQMPIMDLYQYISEKAQENPVLDVEAPEAMSVALPQEDKARQLIWETDDSGSSAEGWRGPREEGFLPEPADRRDDFSQMLHLQLQEERMIPDRLLPLCHFLVDSLNRRGYLDDPIELLADIADASVEDMTQALYVIQELSPTGVGARTLEECLVLQLVQSEAFSAHTLKLVTQGLDLLAANNLRAIAALLQVSREEAAACCAAVRALNPIPSRGYRTGSDSIFVIPEAEVLQEGDRWIIRYNERALPRLGINRYYEDLLRQSEDPQLTAYLKKQMGAARSLIREVNARGTTIMRVLECVAQKQSSFFRQGFEQLQPLAISDVAQELSLSQSTVGRAIQGKTILTPWGVLELKQLFSVRSSAGSAVSAASARERLKALIAGEDPQKPLSDEKLCEAMQALGIPLSRRTVAKYRGALGIPPASRRRQAP